jgi:hypothetical protein
MQHRTQLYLDEGQYRWLKQQARQGGSIAGVVRGLIDSARSHRSNPARDSLLSYLIDEPPAEGSRSSTVQTLDQDLYG